MLAYIIIPMQRGASPDHIPPGRHSIRESPTRVLPPRQEYSACEPSRVLSTVTSPSVGEGGAPQFDTIVRE